MSAWIRIPLRLLCLFGLGGVLFASLLIGAYFYVEPSLPEAAELRDFRPQVPLTIFTRDLRLIAVYGADRREPVPYEAIPQRIKNAFLAAEDDRFFEHSGVDYAGILRGALKGAWSRLRGRDDRFQGGSTITQQVSRTAQLVGREYDPWRKFREVLLAYRIEAEFEKEEIFDLFLNTTFFGQRANGIASAARTYFNKSLNDLTLGEIAILAGIPQGPSIMNPYNSPENALGRRSYVLGRMLELGMITRAEREAALNEPIIAQKFDPETEVDAPYLAQMAYEECQTRFGKQACDEEGLRIITTLDSRLQPAANRAERAVLENYDRRHGYRGPLGRIDLATIGIELANDPDSAALAPPPAPAAGDPATDAGVAAVGGDTGSGQTAPPTELSEAMRDALNTLLADYPNRFATESAVVLDVDDLSAEVYLRSLGPTRIGAEAIAWARAYVSDNVQGRYPTVMGDVLSSGDIISLRRDDEGALELAQIPDGVYEYIQGALVALDPFDGAIISLVGGYDFSVSNFNRATQAKRQPGSSFKPFFYLSVLNRGYTLYSIVNDGPVIDDSQALERTHIVENYEGVYRAEIPLRDALYYSSNASADRLIRAVGASYAGQYVERFGFNPTREERNASLALGSLAVTPVELAAAYAILANGGYAVGIRPETGGPPRPYFIERIESNDGELLYDASLSVERVCPEPEDSGAASGRREEALAVPVDQPSELFPWPLHCAERVESPQRIYLIKSVLKDVIQSGSGRRAGNELNRSDIFGKTGTTNDAWDAWFAGGNADIVAVTRIGFDSNARPLGSNEQGGRTAIPAWIDFMNAALDGMPLSELPRPNGIAEIRINRSTGLIAADCNRDFSWGLFDVESLPATESQVTCIGAGTQPIGQQPEPGRSPGSGSSSGGLFDQ